MPSLHRAESQRSRSSACCRYGWKAFIHISQTANNSIITHSMEISIRMKYLWVETINQLVAAHIYILFVSDTTFHPKAVTIPIFFSPTPSLSDSFFDNSFAVPRTELIGDPDRYVKAGSTVIFRCVVRGALEQPSYIIWYHGSQQVYVENRRGWKVTFERDVEGETHSSVSCTFKQCVVQGQRKSLIWGKGFRNIFDGCDGFILNSLTLPLACYPSKRAA